MLLVGDAGGMVNPFNGEGIAYAMESSSIAAEVIVQALARDTASQRYTLCRYFVKLIGYPLFMQIAAQKGLPHTRLMKIVLKLLANLTDPRGGDATDRVINALAKVAPAA